MAGVPVRVRFTEGGAIQGTMARLAQEQNDMVDALEELRVLLTNSSGVPLAVVNYALNRLDAIGQPATGGAPAALSKVSGDNQSAPVNTALPLELVVRVLDLKGGTVAGQTVAWSTLSDAGLTLASATQSNGQASCRVFAGAFAGAFTVLATVAGVGTVTFNCTATGAATAASIEVLGSQTLSGVAGAAIGTKPAVLVRDANGIPFAGQTVVFAVTGGGGSGTGLTAVSDASGVATPGSWTLGAVAGANTMSATAAGLSGSPITFTASGTAAAAATIAASAGTGQTPVAGTAAGSSLQWVLRDSLTNPVQGQAVTITLISEPSPGGTTLGSLVLTSDAAGHVACAVTATPTLVGLIRVRCAFVDANGVTQSADITLTTVAGAPSKWVLSAQPSSNVVNNVAFSQQPAAQICDVNGNPTATSGVTCTASKASGPDTLGGTLTAVTNAQGLATFTNLKFTVATTGGTNTIQFAGTYTAVTSNGVAVAPPTPVKLKFQSQPGGVTVGVGSLAFAVEVEDASNVIVPGATDVVTIALTTPGGATLTGGTGTSVAAVAGTAQFSGLAVSQVGTYTLTATSGSLQSAVSLSFTVAAASGSNLPGGLTLLLRQDLASLPAGNLNTPFSTNQIVGGVKYFSGAANGAIRSVAAQVGLPAQAAAVPAQPDGLDRFVAVVYGTSGSFTNGEKCLSEIQNMPTTAVGIGVRMKLLISSNFYGETVAGGSFKRWYARGVNGTVDPLVLLLYGKGAASIRFATNLQTSYGTDHGTIQTHALMTRNQWYTVELFYCAESSVGAADAHWTLWINGTKFQITGIGANLDKWNTSQQLLNYSGGQAGTTTPPAGNGGQFAAIGDGLEVWYTTSYMAPP